MSTNPDEEQGKLEGIAFDCKLSLLGATAKLDTATAPQIGDPVRIVIEGMISETGVKVVADKQHPYIKAQVSTMVCQRARRVD